MEVARVATRGCGTCRGKLPNVKPGPSSNDADRKILCDRGTPTCLQCARSKRTCQGYGLRLSWPRPGDGKRAIVMKRQSWRKATKGDGYTAHARLVNAYSRDVELHYHLTASLPIRPTLRIPLPWNPSQLKDEDLDLFQYCKAHILACLPTYQQSETNISSKFNASHRSP